LSSWYVRDCPLLFIPWFFKIVVAALVIILLCSVVVIFVATLCPKNIAANGWACRTRAIKNLRLLQRDKINETQ
jgi:hypothetical protein